MKRMTSFTRGVRSEYVLPRKGGTVTGLFKGVVFTVSVTHPNTVCICASAF